MQSETVIIINSEKSLRQLSNALVRVGIKPEIKVAEMEDRLKKSNYDKCFVIPMEYKGVNYPLFVRLRSYIDVNLAYSSRFKEYGVNLIDLNKDMFVLSLPSSYPAIAILTMIAFELGGAYIVPNTGLKVSDGVEGNFHRIKGKI